VARLNRAQAAAAVAAALIVVLAAAPAPGQERALNQGHPVRLDDAYPLAAGDGTLLAAGTLRFLNEGTNRGVFPLDAQYSILPNTQISIGTVLTTTPYETSDPGSGDLAVAGRVALGKQSNLLPRLAVQAGVTLPTGIGSRAVDVELKGLASRAVTLGLLPLVFHINAAVDFRASHLGDDERVARYHLVVGASFAVPQHPTTTLVSDVFADQSVTRGRAETVGAEFGVRQRVSSRVAVGAAVGTEFAGPRDRSPFFTTFGLSLDFDLPAFGKAR
jgi:hypothetical protein